MKEISKDAPKASNNALTRQNTYLHVLHQTALALGRRQDPLTLLETILIQAAKLVDTKDGYVYLVNKEKSRLEISVGIGQFRKIVGKKFLKLGESLSGKIWQNGKSLRVKNYDTWSGKSGDLKNYKLKSVIGVPLTRGKEVIGVIALSYQDDRTFSKTDLEALERLAELASISLDNALLYQETKAEIAERKQAEADVKRTEQRSHQLEQITAKLEQQRSELIELNRIKDDFISIASHQLRTPATGVKQWLGMLLEGYAGSLTSDQAELAERAYEANNRQIAIINDLLKVAQVDAGKVELKKELTDLVAIVDDVIANMALRFQIKNQRVTFDHQYGKIRASIDKLRFRMVLENILDNAAKYSPERSKIDITLEKNGKYAVISVKDQGVGIKKKDIEKIFDKFGRVDNSLSTSAGGTGLGLYWAMRIVKLHDGDIKVTSVVGKCTTFSIYLPL